MGNTKLVRDSLDALHADASYAHTELGIKNNVASNALFNTRGELIHAKEIIAQSKHLSPSDFTYCTDNAKQNVLKAVQQADASSKAIADAIGRGKISQENAPGKKTLAKIAIRATDVQDAINKAKDYAYKVDTLTKQYANSSVITPGVIRATVASHEDPGNAIKDRLRESRQLASEYKGKSGLTEHEITTTVFGHTNPRKKLDDTLRDIPAVRAALGPDRISENTARDLILRNSDPVGAGEKMLAKADGLKAQLASNPEAQATLSHDDYLTFSQQPGGGAAAATKFAHNMAVGRKHFENSTRVTEAILRKASKESGDVITNATNLAEKVQQLQNTHVKDDIPKSVIERAVVASTDPEKEIGDFMRNRAEIKRQFGDTPPRHAVNRICRESQQPVDEIGTRMQLVKDAMDAPENAGRSKEDLIKEIFAKPSKDLHPTDKPCTAQQILADMQAASRESGTKYSGAHQQQYVHDLATKAAEWAQEHPAGDISPTLIGRTFARMYYEHTTGANNHSLLEDETLLRAVFDDYNDYVRWLTEHGIQHPASMAKYTSREEIERQIAIYGPDWMRQLKQASERGRVVDPIGAVDELSNQARRPSPPAKDATPETADNTAEQQRNEEKRHPQQEERQRSRNSNRPRATTPGDKSVGGVIAVLNLGLEHITESEGMLATARTKLQAAVGSLAVALDTAGAEAAVAARNQLIGVEEELGQVLVRTRAATEIYNAYKKNL